MTRGPIRTVVLAGSARERGIAHGEAYRDEILKYASERVDLVCSGLWSHATLDRATVLGIADECLQDHIDYSPSLTEEMEGLSSATGLSMAELIVVGGFTDFVDIVHNRFKDTNGPVEFAEDDCTATLIPNHRAGGNGFFAQTWDMHNTATDHVLLLDVRPDDGPRSFVFTTTGCLGQIGMNEAGICVGINNMAAEDGQVGVTWPHVVRKALLQTTIDDALACITDAKLSGAHNYLLFDGLGNGYNIEAFTTTSELTKLESDVVAHTNHALAPHTFAVAQPRADQLLLSSKARLDTALDLTNRDNITIDDVMAMTRNPTICYRGGAPFHVETCGAAIMRPSTNDFWACWGLPSENEYQHMSFDE